jgi:hypothetical protein
MKHILLRHTCRHTRLHRGTSVIDIVVGTALMLMVFLALAGILRASLILSTLARAQAGATAIARVQMEYLRGISYDSLGTVGGIPSGMVAQDATTTENGIPYIVHTFVGYIDDSADGTGVGDTTGITTDYKRARVSVSYVIGGNTREVVMVSNFAPPGFETSNGGGTLETNIVDAFGAPVPGASVHIVNSITNPSVDLTTLSNASGTVYLPGAATSSDYQVSVTKSGYSSAQTYARDATNQNPTPGYLTVAKDQTTTGTFAIDLLATLTLATFSPVATSTFADSFADASQLAAMSSTTVSGDALTLLGGETSGSARSVATSSARLARWGEASASPDTPPGTAVLVHIYDGSGALVSDVDLPGNAAGFASFPVPLYNLSTTTYTSLALGADFSGTVGFAPTIEEWLLSYTAGPWPLPNAALVLTGAKTIGSTGGGAPIYKTIVSTATGGDGTRNLSLEWDSYALALSGYDLLDACPTPPFALSPAGTFAVNLFLGAASAHSLRVLVTNNAGNIVSGAQVTLARPGFSETSLNSSCGSAYFGGISSSGDYDVTISKTGYTTTNFTGVVVSGATSYGASFP